MPAASISDEEVVRLLRGGIKPYGLKSQYGVSPARAKALALANSIDLTQGSIKRDDPVKDTPRSRHASVGHTDGLPMDLPMRGRDHLNTIETPQGAIHASVGPTDGLPMDLPMRGREHLNTIETPQGAIHASVGPTDGPTDGWIDIIVTTSLALGAAENTIVQLTKYHTFKPPQMAAIQNTLSRIRDAIKKLEGK